MSNETKTQVTFGKQTQPHVGTAPTADIFVCGVALPVGEITTHKWYKHGYAGTGVVVDSYIVTIWDIKEDKCFEATDYASARSALYAARRYAKEALTALHAPQVEETPVEEALEPLVKGLPETPVVETEEARCYHVTRCKFDPRGNPSAWVTDSSYSTLNEARARCAELVAELGGAVDPSSLSAHSCETVGDVGIQLVYDTLPARDNTKTYVGAHSGAYLYETSPLEEEALKPLVKGLPEAPAEETQRAYQHSWDNLNEVDAYNAFIEAVEREAPAEEEEARVIRVTPPQVDALRALGYEVRSCKLRYYSSNTEEILTTLYNARSQHNKGDRRVYTALINKVSNKPRAEAGARRAFFNSGDLRIEYITDNAHRQFIQLIDAAESAGIISKTSANILRSACIPTGE